MHPFHNILVQVDSDDPEQPPLRRAVEQSRLGDAHLTIATVVEEPPWWAAMLRPGVAQEGYEDYLTAARERVERLAAKVAAAGLQTTPVTLSGKPWLEIIRQVIRGGHDLLVKAFAAESEFAFHVPADMQILRKCPCPVWMVKPRAARRFRRIVAAVDEEPGDPLRHAFNTQIVALAHSLAGWEQCEVHVVRAWSLYEDSPLRFKLAPEDVAAFRQREHHALQEALERLVEPFRTGGPPTELHLVEGQPEDVIPAIVEREHEDLVVMGTIARAGVAGLISGGMAEKILRRVNCSVLAIKPHDFVSPVRLD